METKNLKMLGKSLGALLLGTSLLGCVNYDSAQRRNSEKKYKFCVIEEGKIFSKKYVLPGVIVDGKCIELVDTAPRIIGEEKSASEYSEKTSY